MKVKYSTNEEMQKSHQVLLEAEMAPIILRNVHVRFIYNFLKEMKPRDTMDEQYQLEIMTMLSHQFELDEESDEELP